MDSTASTTCVSWAKLPNELIITILKFFIKGKEPCAPLAAVSQHWQALIEPHTFSQITLTASRMDKFDKIMTEQRQKYVRYLWLSLELQEYPCEDCDESDDESDDGYEDPYTIRRSESAFIGKSFYKLFKVLNSWPSKDKLVLDISVHSPSDNKHGFKYLTVEPDWKGDDPAWLCPRKRDMRYISPHTEETGCETPLPEHHALHKLFSDIHLRGPSTAIGDPRWWLRLPKVPAITSIMLRQQNRRRWNPEILAHLTSLCPRLEDFNYEPWREWERDVQVVQTDPAYTELFCSLSTVRNLVLFENFSEKYARSKEADRERPKSKAVSKVIAAESRSLEKLSASFLADGKYFFKYTDYWWRWPNLTSFAITSKLLTPNGTVDRINKMLIRAAAVAERMPKLRVLEIWNGAQGEAMVFRYESPRNGGTATAVCRGTWPLLLSEDVRTRWAKVAERQHCCIAFDWESVNPDLVSSHAVAITMLGLVNQVIRPISRQQIHFETLQRNRI